MVGPEGGVAGGIEYFKGVLQLASDRYRWKLQDIEQICDGERVFTILHEDEEVQIHQIDASSGDEGSHPLKILDSYDKGYSFRFGERQDADGEKLQFVCFSLRMHRRSSEV